MVFVCMKNKQLKFFNKCIYLSLSVFVFVFLCISCQFQDGDLPDQGFLWFTSTVTTSLRTRKVNDFSMADQTSLSSRIPFLVFSVTSTYSVVNRSDTLKDRDLEGLCLDVKEPPSDTYLKGLLFLRLTKGLSIHKKTNLGFKNVMFLTKMMVFVNNYVLSLTCSIVILRFIVSSKRLFILIKYRFFKTIEEP